MDENAFTRLETFVNNIEDKLSSMKGFYEKFYELISLFSQTHGSVFQELATIKTLLNQTKIERERLSHQIEVRWDEKVEEDPLNVSTNTFQSKSVTNLNPNKHLRDDSPVDRQTDQNSLYSSSSLSQEFPASNTLKNDSRPSSSPSKRSSSLKKSHPQTLTRVKSPKSVSFVLDKSKETTLTVAPQIQPQDEHEEEEESTPTATPTNSDLLPDLFHQHHHEITTKTNIGYQMGSATGHVRIHEIESNNGEYLRLFNTSNSIDYDLTGHFLQQNMACVPICRFRFPFNTIIRAGQTVTVYCGALRNIEAKPPEVFVWKEQRQWEIGPECVTVLAKPTGQAIAWTRSSHRIPTDPTSSEIFSISSKPQLASTENSSISTNSQRSASRLSTSTFIGNSKGSTVNLSASQSDIRSPMLQKASLNQLLNRPKASPFASHAGCKQDLICMNILRTKSGRGDQQSTVKI